MGSIEVSIRCPHNKIIFDPQMGVRVCAETGEVLEENIITDEGEWQAYIPEERVNRARTGGAVSYSKLHMGVDVQVGPRRGPGSRKPRGLSKSYEPLKVQKAFRSMGSLEKNVSSALVIIDDIVAKLELPRSVKEEAARIYREAAQKGLTRGRSVEAMVAASLYAACRRHKVPCSIDEIISHIKPQETEIKREAVRNYKLLVRDLNLTIPVLKPENFVHRIASAMNMKEEVLMEAIKIIIEAKKKGIPSGKDPGGLAAAALYLAALKHNYKKTQKEIAQIAGVTEITVRNRYKEITQALKIEN